MEYYPEVKLMKDAYGTGFSNGLSMCQSQSAMAFHKVEDRGEEVVYDDDRQHRIVLHKKINGQAVEVSTEFINESSGEVTLEMLSSFAMKGIHADRIHRMQSFWSAEGKLRTESIEELHLEPSWNRCGMRVEKFGNTGSMPVRKYFPFLILEDSREQEFIGVQLYCPSSWQIELLCREDETLTVAGGIADRDFGQWTKKLYPGESFETPKAVIARGNTIYEVCDKLVKAQKPAISSVDNKMGIIFNEFCTTWGNPGYDNIKRICDKLKGKGIQYLVIDAGWYGKAQGWWSSMGDWEVNEDKFPGGLKEAADYIRSCGMIPGVWFELEVVGINSEHWQDKEHLLLKDGVPLTVGERRFWDMEDAWVTDYLHEKVIKRLKECGFGYLKVDYNDTIGMGCDGPESPGENLRRKVRATQGFFKRIKEEIPEIVIENCSSGGHRLEPSMMELVSQGSFSDAHETAAIPLIAANLHRAVRPEQSQIWAVLRAGDSSNRIFYSIISTFLGRMCLSGDIYDLSDAQWALVEQGMHFYGMASDIIRDGITVKCEYSTAQYNHPTGSQLVIRQLGSRCLAILHRFEGSVAPDLEFLKNNRVIAEYGSAEEDFSAKAWIYEVNLSAK